MTVADIFDSNFPKVSPKTRVLEIAEILDSKGLAGLPVVNEYGVTAGVVERNELFSRDNKIHLPTYIRLLKDTDFVMGGKQVLPYAAEKILRMTAGEVMNKKNVFFVSPDTPLAKLASKFLEYDTEIMPVVNPANQYLGAVTKADLIRLLAGKEGATKQKAHQRNVDLEVDFVESDFTSKFAYVAKVRANIWLTAAAVLFILGFLAGVIYVANPRLITRQENSTQN